MEITLSQDVRTSVGRREKPGQLPSSKTRPSVAGSSPSQLNAAVNGSQRAGR